MSTLRSSIAQGRIALFFATALVLLAPMTVLAQTTTFSVESYIPERFIDTEWRLYGGFGLYGNDYDRGRMSTPFSRYVTDESGDSYGSKDANLGSFIRYRYETIPRYLDLRLGIGSRYYNDDSEYYTAVEDTSGDYRRFDYDNEYESYRVDFNPSVDAGVYLLNDFFLSAFGEAGLGYSDYPTRDHSRKNYDVYPQPYGYIRTRRSEDITEGSRDRRSYHACSSLLPGWGRVYEGEFASTAMYIVDELRKNNLLAYEPTTDQMLKLSAIIHQYRLKHAIDYRLHKIEAMETIGEYLRSEGLMVAPDPLGILAIEDVWTYFPKFSRRFGFRVRAGFGFDYEYDREQRKDTREYYNIHTYYHEDTTNVIDTTYFHADTSHYHTYDKNTETFPHIVVEVDYHRPFTYRWQLSLLAQMRYYIGATSERTTRRVYRNTSETVTHENWEIDYKHFYEADCSGTIRYILNSRTSTRLLGTVGYGHVDREVTHQTKDNSTITKTTYDGPSYDDWHYSVNLNVTYRISIPTTLTVSGSYRSGTDVRSVPDDYKVYDTEGYSLAANITYYIF